MTCPDCYVSDLRWPCPFCKVDCGSLHCLLRHLQAAFRNNFADHFEIFSDPLPAHCPQYLATYIIGLRRYERAERDVAFELKVPSTFRADTFCLDPQQHSELTSSMEMVDPFSCGEPVCDEVWFGRNHKFGKAIAFNPYTTQLGHVAHLSAPCCSSASKRAKKHDGHQLHAEAELELHHGSDGGGSHGQGFDGDFHGDGFHDDDMIIRRSFVSSDPERDLLDRDHPSVYSHVADNEYVLQDCILSGLGELLRGWVLVLG